MENIRNASFTIGTTSTVICQELVWPTQRKALVLTNVSTAAQVISITFETEAAANFGIVLFPGGSWSETLDSRFTPSNAKISAAASAAGGLLALHERITAWVI